MTPEADDRVRRFQTGLLTAVREYFALEGMSVPQPLTDAFFAGLASGMSFPVRSRWRGMVH